MPKPPLYLVGMGGLGDNAYQRCIIRGLAEDWDLSLASPWPQIYRDLDVEIVRHPLGLRTQGKNMERFQLPRRPTVMHQKRMIGYGTDIGRGKNIIQSLEAKYPIRHGFRFDLPRFGRSPVQSKKPVAVIRPVTERREWLNQARNPHHRYIEKASAILRDQGYFVVSVADLDRGLEWMQGRVNADRMYHKGELSLEKLFALVANAAVVVGPVGWILPVSIAYGTPAVIIGGGHGRYNRPDTLTDPRMDTTRLRWLLPDPFCLCDNMAHRCNKRIPRFTEQFGDALAEVTAKRVRVAA